MNILIVSYYQIYPLETGASIAQFGILEYLSKLCNVHLLITHKNLSSSDKLFELKTALPAVKIHIIENNDTNELKKSFLLKIFKAILETSKDIKNALIKLIRKFIYIKNEDPFEEFGDPSWNYNPFYLHNQQTVDAVNKIISEERIDIVQLEAADALSLVATIPGDIKKIFVNHESRYIRIKSHIDSKQIKSKYVDYFCCFNKYIEQALLEKFDAVLTFSESDLLLMKGALSKESNVKLFTSPYSVLDRDFKKIKRETFCQPTKLVFVGADFHYPNQDAVEWFLEEAATQIYKTFNLKLYVVGRWEKEVVKKYKNHESRVEFVGFVEDLYEIMKNSINIVPVRIGGGLKTKVMVSMAQGVPVISTKAALTGINAEHLKDVLIANDAKAFSWSIDYLLSDLDRTFEICQNAQNLIKRDFSQSAASERRCYLYHQLLEDRDN